MLSAEPLRKLLGWQWVTKRMHCRTGSKSMSLLANPISDTKKKTPPDNRDLSKKSQLFPSFPNYNVTLSHAVILQSSSSVTGKDLLLITMTMYFGWLCSSSSCDKSGLCVSWRGELLK